VTDVTEQLLRELRDLRADLRRLVRLSPVDHTKLAALFPAVLASVGDRCFSATELCEFARSELQGAFGLRVALECAIGATDQGAARRVGKLFARGSGVDVLGLRVEQVGTDGDGAIWAIRREFADPKLIPT